MKRRRTYKTSVKSVAMTAAEETRLRLLLREAITAIALKVMDEQHAVHARSDFEPSSQNTSPVQKLWD
jgi:hypothetical protein